ncbi:hypothetical protein, partial [Collinsella tanakaei]|uniref:hypothetical protein n=1 Tax=Collinsella tanakaei TaxID=626935 RepID=UPI00195A1F8B
MVDTFHAADEKGVAWEDVEGMSDADVFSQALLSEKSAPFFRVSPRKVFGFRRGHAAIFLTCPA